MEKGKPAKLLIESARDLLARHGVSEDVIDGALSLHEQELNSPSVTLDEKQAEENMFEGMHVGRHWVGHEIENRCPCVQAACGLVVSGEQAPGCVQHLVDRSIRQAHRAEDCPGKPSPECSSSISGFCLRKTHGGDYCDATNRDCARTTHPEK